LLQISCRQWQLFTFFRKGLWLAKPKDSRISMVELIFLRTWRERPS
jgi:hypothetical protein